MSEHMPITLRETLVASILATCDYVGEWADDATLFALLATLAQHAVHVAQRLDGERLLSQPSSDLAQTSTGVTSCTGALSRNHGVG